MEKIDMPFRLILFDNHTDMQPPAFGGLLSCGGWAAEALEKTSSFTGGDPHRPGSGSVRSGGSGSAKTGEISFTGETERGA